MFLDSNSTMLDLMDKIIFIRYVKNDTLFESPNGDIRRLVGKTYKQKWKHFKQIIKV